MQLKREPMHIHLEGPLSIDGLPTDIVYAPQLRIHHDEDAQAAERLVDLLMPFAGRGAVRRYPFLGTRVVWQGKYPMRARLRSGTLDLRVGRRLKGNALPRLVTALAGLQGARDLALEGERPAFCGDYDDIGPCTPCAANRYSRKG
ncbi:MAG: hypothetical protein KY455_14265 [Euryarchaeota archaeon]|nr:hypothetical protein [Euryarchaeota archaeon]